MSSSVIQAYVPPPDVVASPAGGEAISLKLLDARRVVFLDPPPEPVVVFTLGGQGICTAGNLTVISGQSKSGKSAAITAMLAATLGTDNSLDFLGFAAAETGGKKILAFDTEQSPYDAWSLQARALKRAGCTAQPPNLEHFYLLDLSVHERRGAVFAGCRRADKEGDGIFAVFLDGIADLLVDVNDAAQANDLISDLVALSVEVGAPIICVLHENPSSQGGNTKTRGHLGSQLERKAESNLRVIKGQDGISCIFSDKCRRASIPQHAGPRFEWNDEVKMHVSVEPATVAKAESAYARLKEEVAEVFDHPGATGGLARPALVARIEEVFGLAKGGARKRFDKLRAAGVIRQNSQNLWIR